MLDLQNVCHCCLLDIQSGASEQLASNTEVTHVKFEDTFSYNEQSITFTAAYLVVNACNEKDVADLGLINICNLCKVQLESAYIFQILCKEAVRVLRQHHLKDAEEQAINEQLELEDPQPEVEQNTCDFVDLSSPPSPPCEENELKLEFEVDLEQDSATEHNLSAPSLALESHSGTNMTLPSVSNLMPYEQTTQMIEYHTFRADIDEDAVHVIDDDEYYSEDNRKWLANGAQNPDDSSSHSEYFNKFGEPSPKRFAMEIIYKCEACHLLFNCHTTYSKHKLQHEPIIIDDSNDDITQTSSVNNSVHSPAGRNESGLNLFCKFCKIKFKSAWFFIKHNTNLHPGMRYQCHLCASSYGHFQSLKYHMKKMHQNYI